MSSDQRFGAVGAWLPALQWLPAYPSRALRLDGIAGLSLAAFVIPESLAYATLAGLPPISGLYCYLTAGLVYALFGTSRQLAVGPTSALAVVVAASVAAMGGGDPGRTMAVASAIALMMGLISVAGRFIGLANIAYFVSDTVLSGFKIGAALYIASTQLPKLFGLHGTQGSFVDRIWYVIVSLPETHFPSLALGLAAIALFLWFERRFPGRPTTLVVVVASILLMKLFHLTDLGIKVVGDLPIGLPRLGLPRVHFADLAALVDTAFACFILAYAETISTVRSFAQKHGYEADPEQELTALGAANIATGLAHGFPVAGGMSQTAVNDMGGASSPVALIVTSAAIALTLLFFAGFFHDLPEPILGAIVLMAAKHLVRIEDLRRLRAVSRAEFRLALLALFGVLAFGLLDGILLAAVGSLIVLIAFASAPRIAILEREPEGERFLNRALNRGTVGVPGVLILRTAGAWVYFNADHIRRAVLDLVEKSAETVGTVILDFTIVPSIDLTAGAALGTLVKSLRARGVAVEFAELRDDLVASLKAIDAAGELGPVVPHRSIRDCLAGAGNRPRIAGGVQAAET